MNDPERTCFESIDFIDDPERTNFESIKTGKIQNVR